ncbi:LPS assembly protein LptD [uncultured Helicobacter sp.]|uniref:LPS-assembly protein LptD n=5 Tax=uncultured Helicobacter sp. TaxID=175537 RepID=UPI0025FE8F47|nr:LPS assembly protein LptD [uncultured Helicobacter sp.]
MKTLSFVRLLCVWALLFLSMNAEQKADSIFDLSADNVSAKDEEVIAEGNAFLLYGDVYMVAHKIIYNKQTKYVYLRGGAKIYQGDILYLDVEQADIDMQTKQVKVENIYLQSTMGIWVMAKDSQGQDGVYSFKRGVISGCDVVYPLWHLNVSSGTYNTQKGYMSVWNPRFYIGAVPIFYLPYFVAPTGNVRKSGLLSPEMSYSNKQGFMYSQPLFIAPFNPWDMTLSPQIRTERGAGAAVEFRFADSDNSIATFQMRYFQNNDEYMLLNNLKNQDIYGGTFNYQTQNVITGENNQYVNDGFYADITYMNDLEYMRLKSLNASFNTRLYESRVNYYLNSSKHYFGTYLKYYLDLSKVSNKDTFQVLPQVHYHYYTDSLFFKNLLYTFDFQSKHITRPSGYGYWQNTMSLPIGVVLPLFNDYISVGANVDMYGTSVLLQNAQGLVDSQNVALDNAINYAVGSYNISLNSDLARPYKHFFHSLHLEAIFSGALYKYTSDAIADDRYEAYNALVTQDIDSNILAMYWNPSDIVDVVKNKHKVDLKLSQYFYGKNGKELFYWRMYQRLFLQDSFLSQSQTLRNELGFSPLSGLNLSASLFYSYARKSISETSLNASFSKWGLDSSLTYYFKLDPLYLSSGLYSSGNTGFARGSLGYDFGLFRLNANIGYDVGVGYLKDWYVTISKDIRCFGIGLKFAQDVRPTLTADNNITPITNQYVKIEFRFVPLADTGLTYRFKE